MMFDAEEKLWWYKFSQHKVLKAIKQKFGINKDIRLLDAGCGTGGLMSILRKEGYTNIVGFDYAVSAVQFSQERGLPVSQLSIDDICKKFSAEKFDVIVCDDVIYTLEIQQIRDAFKNIDRLLNPNGILISNNNAFEFFRGTHDIAVGSKHRFTLNGLK
jgi:2-polyprenyl-3-methyl-5-hydroxy-6-metoxy-1,4-benzoquinol methylase